jgi:TPR repeat protein
MYNFGRCLEYGKGIDKDFLRAAKYYRLSAELENSAAQNSFGICLERGIGVHKNLFLAAQYYQRAAQQGHPDGANNFGFCLEHGRGVEQNIELATTASFVTRTMGTTRSLIGDHFSSTLH